VTRQPDTARILICEDSATYAEAFTRFLQLDQDLRVVARCSTGEEALASLLRVSPHLVVLDLELPGAGGLEVARRMLRLRPVPVLVLSAHVERGPALVAAALGAGVLDARPKSDISLADPLGARAVAFRRYVKRLAYARVSGVRATDGRNSGDVASRRQASVVAICASTGGPPALDVVLGALPADFAPPVLVVQHISPGFLDGLIGWLDQRVALPVRRARDACPVERGVWFAPDDAHLVLDQTRRTRFDTDTVAGYHRPSADVLFTSVAASAGSAAAAVVLTGMGSDGAEGVAAVRAAGGLTIAQDERTSSVYGMPRAAAEQGAEMVLPLPEIGKALSRLQSARAGA
jgi:two-component system chemotaxis response regulator CheB